MNGYPIVLDVGNRQIVIVGGGNVALRKIKGLLESGAKNIRVVAPKFHQNIPQQVQRITQNYRSEHLSDASLVYAATDSGDVNEQVERDAHEIGALVCRADADDSGDFSTPAMHRNGPLLVTVSSGGPVLSAMVRDRIAEKINPQWVQMAEAMQKLRPIILEEIPPANRKKVLLELCSDEAFDVLSRGGVDGLMSWMKMSFQK